MGVLEAPASPSAAAKYCRLRRVQSHLQPVCGRRCTCGACSGAEAQCIAALVPAPTAAAAAGELTVRVAEPGEYVQIAEVVNEAFGHWAAHYIDWSGRVTVDELLEEVTRGRELGYDSELLVCVDSSGGLCGTVLLNQWYAAEDFPSAGRPDTDSFGQLAVSASARRKGVGQELVAAAEARAMARGKSRMDICFVSVDAAQLGGTPPARLPFRDQTAALTLGRLCRLSELVAFARRKVLPGVGLRGGRAQLRCGKVAAQTRLPGRVSLRTDGQGVGGGVSSCW